LRHQLIVVKVECRVHHDLLDQLEQADNVLLAQADLDQLEQVDLVEIVQPVADLVDLVEIVQPVADLVDLVEIVQPVADLADHVRLAAAHVQVDLAAVVAHQQVLQLLAAVQAAAVQAQLVDAEMQQVHSVRAQNPQRVVSQSELNVKNSTT
jgi:hypothetical protein